MKTKLDKVATRINDAFGAKLVEAFKLKFNREIETQYDIFAMQLISRPADGKLYTVKQKEWVMAFDAGYCAAMGIATYAAFEDMNRRTK